MKITWMLKSCSGVQYKKNYKEFRVQKEPQD